MFHSPEEPSCIAYKTQWAAPRISSSEHGDKHPLNGNQHHGHSSPSLPSSAYDTIFYDNLSYNRTTDFTIDNQQTCEKITLNPPLNTEQYIMEEQNLFSNVENKHPETDPFSLRCRIPLLQEGTLSKYQLWLMETSFMCRRNERERQRVRNVNDGFARLRNHLPRGSKPRRQSKVETLKLAIEYIKELQDLLHGNENN